MSTIELIRRNGKLLAIVTAGDDWSIFKTEELSPSELIKKYEGKKFHKWDDEPLVENGRFRFIFHWSVFDGFNKMGSEVYPEFYDAIYMGEEGK